MVWCPDACMLVARDCLQRWDLVVLTQNYIRLFLHYLESGELGIAQGYLSLKTLFLCSTFSLNFVKVLNILPISVSAQHLLAGKCWKMYALAGWTGQLPCLFVKLSWSSGCGSSCALHWCCRQQSCEWYMCAWVYDSLRSFDWAFYFWRQCLLSGVCAWLHKAYKLILLCRTY